MNELTHDQRDALWFLASGRATVAEIALQGITIEILNCLVSAGHATKIVETLGRGPDAIEVTRGWEITPVGREALREVMKRGTGARFEIAVDGKPRSYRSGALTAREGAIFLKTKHPHSEVTVRDLKTGEVTMVKHPLSK